MKKSVVPSRKKPFREIILQVGGKGNMNADTENGELAKQILDEYYQGFLGAKSTASGVLGSSAYG